MSQGYGQASKRKQRVVIALFYQYYLFDYFRDLIPQLIDDGFAVTLISFDDRIRQDYGYISGLDIKDGPWLIRGVWNRSKNPFMRMVLWLLGWVWVAGLKRSYDFAIVPWDYGILRYIFSRSFPSLTIHNVTDFLDIDLKLQRSYLPEDREKTLSHRIFLWVEKIIGREFLPRCNGRILKYSMNFIVDRIMGYRSINGLQGFSRIPYFTVMGEEISNNYRKLGVGLPPSPTEIFVTGSPSYERIMKIPSSFGPEERKELRESLGVPCDGVPLFSFFLSPSSFSDTQIREIVDVVHAVQSVRNDAYFLLKFHPKTRKGDPEKILGRMGTAADRVRIMKEFKGDSENARLILSSDCLVQKQGTVGYIAMLFNVPVLSYNLYPTDYDDDMYRIIGGSFHAESVDELQRNIVRLDDPSELEELHAMQASACRKFCAREDSPCSLISRVIQRHFEQYK